MPSPGVRVTIAGDASDLEKALAKSSGALSGFGKTALGVFGGGLLLKGFDAAVDGVRALGGFVTDGIGKLDEYGDNLARLDAVAKGLGRTATSVDLSRFGVDQGEAAASALAIAKLGNAIGLSGAELQKITPDTQRWAAQLASLGDGDPAAQAELIAKALAGNAKAAKALGIELPKGVTGMAAYQAIAAQLGPQLDQATAGTASLADVGERWDATLANLQLELAGYLDQLAPVISAMLDQLLPVLRELATRVGPVLAQVVGTITRAFGTFVSSGGMQSAGGILADLADVASRLARFFGERVLPVVAQVAAAVGKALGPVVKSAAAAFREWEPVLAEVFGFVEDVVVPILTRYVIPSLGTLLGLTLDVAGKLGGLLAGALRTVSGLFQRLLDFIRPILDGLRSIASLAGQVGRALPQISLPFSLVGGGAAAAGRSARSSRAGVVNVYVTGGNPDAVVGAIRRYASTSGGPDGFARAIAR
jgi:hypothetical protein